jgi:hypothetical protein
MTLFAIDIPPYRLDKVLATAAALEVHIPRISVHLLYPEKKSESYFFSVAYIR